MPAFQAYVNRYFSKFFPKRKKLVDWHIMYLFRLHLIRYNPGLVPLAKYWPKGKAYYVLHSQLKINEGPGIICGASWIMWCLIIVKDQGDKTRHGEKEAAANAVQRASFVGLRSAVSYYLMQFRSSQNTITKARKVAATSILIVYLVRFNEAEEYSERDR